jgi:hypothetical protein
VLTEINMRRFKKRNDMLLRRSLESFREENERLSKIVLDDLNEHINYARKQGWLKDERAESKDGSGEERH